MSMIEKVARALCEKHGLAYTGQAVFLDLARAAIEAMREPTDLMGNGLPTDYRPGSHSATQIWRAMIDEALK